MTRTEHSLQQAIATNADPSIVSPSGTCFAWRPIYGWNHKTRSRTRLWLQNIIWFRPLGLLTEYSSYAGSEREFRDRHGRYSWQKEAESQ